MAARVIFGEGRLILSGTLKLEAVLAAAITTNQPEFHVTYLIHNTEGLVTPPQYARGSLNSTTDATLLAAPSTDAYYFEVLRVTIYNADTASVTVTVKTDDTSTEKVEIKKLVGAGNSLCYEKGGRGWYTTDSANNTFTSPTLTSANVSDGSLSLKSAQMQFFILQVTNTAGTIQHRIISDFASAALGSYSGKINGASATLQNTPNGANASTAFTTGVKISSANLDRLYFDTAAQTTADAFLHGFITQNDTGTDYKVAARFDSFDINGVTRNRPGLRLTTGTAGAGSDWNTTNIPAGKSLFISCMALFM